MKTGHRFLLLGTVGWVGLFGAWSHQRFSRQGAHPEVVELYQAVSKTLPRNLGSSKWLKVAETDGSADGLPESAGKGAELTAGAEGWLRDYPELLRAECVEYGLVRYGDLEAEVEVFFVLSGGRVAPCIFRFRFENRGWKMQGVKFGRPDAEPIGGIRI